MHVNSLAVVGLSHHTAPVEVRERFVFDAEATTALLRDLVERGFAAEAVLLSTCNRVEVYFVEAKAKAKAKAEAKAEAEVRGAGKVAALLAERAGYREDEARVFFYTHHGQAAVQHLYRVAASLDSMVLGEAQVQGQVRAAYEQAAAMGDEPRVIGPVLARLFQSALGVGARVRSETALGVGAASVPGAAIELARKIFGSLRERRALVLGAGEMSELALECLAREGVRSAVVANRNETRARELAARVGGAGAGYEELPALLPQTDIVVAATAAPHALLTRALFERVFGRGPRHPLLLVDIALPRDIEPAVGEVENVFLYDIDDLHEVVDENLARRTAELPAAERIVREEADAFGRWYLARDVVPLIRALRERGEAMRQAEMQKIFARLPQLTAAEREELERLTRQMLSRLLHAPTVRLREAASNGHTAEMLEAARFLFELDDSPHAPRE